MVTKRGTNQYHGALYEFYFGSNVGAANLWKNNLFDSRTAGISVLLLQRDNDAPIQLTEPRTGADFDLTAASAWTPIGRIAAERS